MAQFVKLPSGLIVNVDKIGRVHWDADPERGRYLAVGLGVEDGFWMNEDPDSRALWRYLCEHSDATT